MDYRFSKKNSIYICIVLALVVTALITYIKIKQHTVLETPDIQQTAVIPHKKEIPNSRHEILGTSVDGRSIENYSFGTGDTHVAFVGGIHGGYEWNSVLLAYKFIDYFTQNPQSIPKNLTIDIIPSANPDGIFKVTQKEGRFSPQDVTSENTSTGSGRLNSNDVDLNRNFDCKWQPESKWRDTTVSAGTKAFSEPESQVIKSFVEKNKPASVVFFHSQSNAVYASECSKGILPKTLDIMNAYSHASGYTPIDNFNSYPITGDAEGWLASIGIPAITVELQTHQTIEWERNLAGVQAILSYFK